MESGSIRLFRVAGIDVRIHVSWLLVVGLVTWSLAVGYFPGAVPGIGEPAAWALGAVAALLLFASVLVHELAHSVVARTRDLEARSITLFLFGGASDIASITRNPSIEAIVAGVGPVTSFVIAGIAEAVALVTPAGTPVQAIASYLATVNALLGAFNLVPGFPLDGGRVLRAIAWSRTGSLRRGTEIAVRVGHLVSYGFMALGVFSLLNGDIVGGIWIATIGWFLNSAGSSSLQQVVLDQRLGGVRVAEILRPDTTSVMPGTSVAELVDAVMLPGSRWAVPVVDGRIVGIVTLSDVARVPADQRASTPVASVMGGSTRLVTIRPEQTLLEALQALTGGDYEQLPVVEGGRLLGLVTRADIMRALAVREALGVERRAGTSPAEPPTGASTAGSSGDSTGSDSTDSGSAGSASAA